MNIIEISNLVKKFGAVTAVDDLSFDMEAGTNLFYLILVPWFFKRMFARVKERGMLMKLD